MDTYNHFQYGDLLARKLKPIRHSELDNHFFRAFGLEDLYDFDDRLSSAHGMILIAVDGNDKSLVWRQSDTVTKKFQYTFIIAQQTSRADSNTIFRSLSQCEPVCEQIAARMVKEFVYADSGYSSLDPGSFQFNGIGPIGENFYGIMLSFSMSETFRSALDPNMWDN